MRRKRRQKQTLREQTYEAISAKRTERERQRDRVIFKLRLYFVEIYL